jgi:NitT/TauT family transport system ATP-binding protein
MSSISLEGVSLTYGPRRAGADQVKVLERLHSTFDAHRTYGIYGPNGAGKSSMFRLIAGFEKPDAGTVRVDNSNAGVAFVWQDYRTSLLPWYDVARNIALKLTLEGAPIARIRAAAATALEQLHLDIPLNRKTFELSGGQQQAVAIARAISLERTVLLMDEPFSALDSQRKSRLLSRLQTVLLKNATTTLMISHELDDLILMSHEIVVMSASPMREVARIDVDLSFPRSERDRRSDAFMEIRRNVLSEAEQWIAS